MEKLTYSLKEFCALHNLSRTSLYSMFNSGLGPTTILIGRRRVIGIEAAKEWRQRMSVEYAKTKEDNHE